MPLFLREQGGIDKREQRKTHSFYEDLVQKRAESGDSIAPVKDLDKVQARGMGWMLPF